MLRAGELTLALAPVLAAILLYLMLFRGLRISRRALALCTLVVLLAGAGLTWLGTSERLDRGERYVPAEFRDGAILPGHGAEPPAGLTPH